MDRRQLHARCRRRAHDLLEAIGLPDPWEINEFLDRLERHRGRAIDVCAVPWSVGDSSGAWLRHADHDVIAYAENTSSLHQDHIILHEIGHMISEHRGRCALPESEVLRQAPELDSPAFAHLLGHGDQAEEAEAEMIATVILARIAGRPGARAGATGMSSEGAATLQRITSVFDSPQRW